MINVGIVGGTGYTGVELLRLLAQHPKVKIKAITSRSEAGMSVAELFTNLRGHIDLKFSDPADAKLTKCDVVFFATPNGIAMQQTESLLNADVKVIDLAADFRIKDVAEWEKWYGMQHACPNLVAEAVYGLPEINRAQVKDARLIANPGCYATGMQLGIGPLLARLQGPPQVFGVSGYSGAGTTPSPRNDPTRLQDNLMPYALIGHLHEREVSFQLGRSVHFTPHVASFFRGISLTISVTLDRPENAASLLAN